MKISFDKNKVAEMSFEDFFSAHFQLPYFRSIGDIEAKKELKKMFIDNGGKFKPKKDEHKPASGEIQKD